MTAITTRNPVRRVFTCWPSRIGAIALLALGVSWGADVFAGPTSTALAQATVAVVE
ncbi:hypothetical protein [Methylopila sp. Yamaguchi]|uniref:hypothetical protein n=1 Tax=Methylopila sp. Yamaguchi TaxID=1437817 RepID=UPI00135C9B93|nr:hypothetical protein [Methylopila sp. Yamaguchi]